MSLVDRLKTSLALEKKELQLEYSFEHKVDLENRVIRVTGEIEYGHFDKLDAALTELESENRKAITIRINCPGGEVYEALGMVGRIQASKCQIITEGYGHVMSAATLILASGDKRRMSKLAHFMHHEPTVSESSLKLSEAEAELRQLKREQMEWCRAMAELTLKPARFWDKEGTGINAYFTPEQCIQYGIVDELF